MTPPFPLRFTRRRGATAQLFSMWGPHPADVPVLPGRPGWASMRRQDWVLNLRPRKQVMEMTRNQHGNNKARRFFCKGVSLFLRLFFSIYIYTYTYIRIGNFFLRDRLGFVTWKKTMSN